MALSPKLAVNKKAALVLLIISLMAPCILKIQPSKASPTTITVPDDYPTITDAISNAKEGDTIFVKKGNYDGPLNQTLVIDKSISLVGEDVNSTKMSLHPPLVPMSIFTYTYMGYAEPIRITASDVELSGFTIITAGGGISATGNGTRITGNILGMGVSATGNRTKIIGNIINQGSGIRISGDNNVIAQNSMLEGWTSFISCTGSFNFIEGNRIVGSTSSESIDLDGSFNVIYGNTLTDCGSIAVGAPPVSVECEGNIIAKNNLTNSSGIYIRGSSNIICANRIANSSAALEIFWGDNNTFYANHVANNTFGARVGFDQTDISRQSGPTAAQNTLYHNNFISNAQQAIDWNWLGTNSWDNSKEGNYWSDYTGGDWNFDGIGDVSYKLSEAISSYAPSTQSEDHYPLMEPFDIDSVTVELPEWASPSTSPSPSPTPTDNKPLPTTLLVAVAIIACVFGFGLIVNLLTAKKKKQKPPKQP
jgi:nitrous oxidase accessory protein